MTWAAAFVVYGFMLCGACRATSTPHRDFQLAPPRPTEPHPGPPTAMALALRYVGDRFELADSAATQARVTAIQPARHAASARSGRGALFEYRMLAADNTVLAIGQFYMPLVEHSAYTASPGSRRITHEESALAIPTAIVSVPIDDRARHVELFRLAPRVPEPPDEWSRERVNTIDLSRR